jgi:hypothetical protein
VNGRKNWHAGVLATHYKNVCDVHVGARKNSGTLGLGFLLFSQKFSFQNTKPIISGDIFIFRHFLRSKKKGY